MKFRLGCKIAHEVLEPGFGQVAKWRETYSMFQMELPRPKWGIQLFRIRCPLCGKKLLLSLASWLIKIIFGFICVGIYGSFAVKALLLHSQGDNIPDSLSYILIFGACGLCICLALAISRGPGILHPLGGRFGEPMHMIDHKYVPIDGNNGDR